MSFKNVEDSYPLSPLQHGMLFQASYAPESDAYIGQTAVRICGELDCGALKEAWVAMIDRNSVLRTAFFWEGLDEPLQVVRRAVDIEWQEYDWRSLERERANLDLEDLLVDERARGFVLSRAPLMRFALVSLAGNEFEFVWTHHHLLLDGWSRAAALDEATAIYRSLRNCRPLPVVDRPPYRKYIDWICNQDLSQSAGQWRRWLERCPAPTSLRLGGTCAPLQQRGNERQQIRRLAVGADFSTDASRMLSRHSLTLNTLFQAAFAILLGRYSGEHDLMWGMTVAGRPTDLPGIDNMLGMFANTLPVRFRVEEDELVLDLLPRMQTHLCEIRQHESSPLAEIAGWAGATSMPLFENIVVFENYPATPALGLSSGEADVLRVRTYERTEHPAAFTALPGAELTLELALDSNRIEMRRATHLLTHWKVLAHAMVLYPDLRVGDLSLSEGRHRTLTAVTPPVRRLVPGWFDQKAIAYPANPAVIFGNQTVSYDELRRQVSCLASHLAQLGARPETPVALFARPSSDLILGMLAILKAGATCVLLHPSFPLRALRAQLRDCRPVFVLTHRVCEMKASELGCRTVHIDASSSVARLPCRARITPDSAAFVFYTSGSTGSPKGVVITHGGLAAYVSSALDVIDIGPGDRFLQFASPGFDVILEEVLLSLLSGAAVVIPEGNPRLELDDLATALERNGVTALELPSAYWRRWMAYLSHRRRRGLYLPRIHIVGGEAMPDGVWAESEKLGISLVHVYGCTEATVSSTFYKTSTPVADCARCGSLPLGQPLTNTSLYVLDSGMRHATAGMTGEIYLGGDGLARGYIGQPDLTATRFLPDAFSSVPGARMYRTGDLSTQLDDGSTIFLGRTDEQIKIRGCRVEPSEVVAAIRLFPSVLDAAVFPRVGDDGDRILSAYVQLGKGGQNGLPDTRLTELRAFLASRLPNHMVPSDFFVVSAIPLTINGKVSRAALLGLQRNYPQREAPSTPTETTLTAIWSRVLDKREIGPHENFFDLGGHSLSAMDIISRIQQSFAVRIPVRRVFELPTVAELAAEIDTVAVTASGAGPET